MMRDGLRRLLRRLAVVLALVGLVVAAGAGFGHTTRPRRGAGAGAVVLPNVGTAGTYTWPTGSITTDAYGRVTDAHASGRIIYTTTPLSGGGSIAADLTLACPTCITGALTAGRVAISAGSTSLQDFGSLLYNGSTLTNSGLTKTNRLAGGSSAPTAAAGAGTQLGTGATCTVAGTDVSGTITLTTGTGPTAMTAGAFNTACTVTFNTTYSGGPKVIVHPANPAAITLQSGSGVVAYVDPTTTGTTSFPLRIASNIAATLPASTVLTYVYMVIQ
jgi:hypothetical protein